jgi:hypothetical protein
MHSERRSAFTTVHAVGDDGERYQPFNQLLVDDTVPTARDYLERVGGAVGLWVGRPVG